MQLKDFLNKVVISTKTKKRMYLVEITAPYFKTVTAEEENGHYTYYSWPTINGNAFEEGYLEFEDKKLQKPFLEVYKAYTRTKEAYWEEYGYWMRRD